MESLLEFGLSNLKACKDDWKMRRMPCSIRTDVPGIPEAGAHTPNVVVGEEPSSVFVLSLGKKIRNSFLIFLWVFARMMEVGSIFIRKN